MKRWMGFLIAAALVGGFCLRWLRDRTWKE